MCVRVKKKREKESARRERGIANERKRGERGRVGGSETEKSERLLLIIQLPCNI